MKKVQTVVNRFLFTVLFAGLVQSGYAQQDVSSSDSLLFMSIEDLMNLEIEVTSVSKKAESIQKVPSSIYVISSKDIERSSATNIMELLRDVPGYWAVSNDFMNVDGYIRNSAEGSVLVLLDGTPMQDLMGAEFSYGNFDIPLNQIDRIEIIKGSGGTVYGANSASGVISIYTKEPDAQSKFFAEVKGGSPAYANANVSVSSKLGEKFSLSAYGKYGYFGGYEQTPESTNAESTVTGQDGVTPVTITNRFTEDDNTVKTIIAGMRLRFDASEKFNLSAGVHFNSFDRDRYVSYSTPENSYLVPTGGNFSNPHPEVTDEIYLRNDNSNRTTLFGKAEYGFSDNHNIFARISSNIENTSNSFGGGFNASNSIVDLEVQDNLTLSFNQFSLGLNYRKVNYDIHDIYSTNNINYIDPQNSANLTGFFAQDKLTFFEDKLSLYLGAKAENFSLINDKYYISPMAKIVYQPIKQLTFWGGYTKAYTTPGYNQTNMEMFVFRTATPDVFMNYSSDIVHDAAYQQAKDGGADDAMAKAIADYYITTEEGQQYINGVFDENFKETSDAFPGHYNISVINGPETEPTSFESFEVGVRYQPNKKLYFETNFYYTNFEDGIGNSPTSFGVQPSPTREGEYTETYYYGNYFTGTNMGLETIIKYSPVEHLMVELSHSYYKSEVYYQENDEFESDPDKNIMDEDYPVIPANVLKWKVYYDMPKDFRLTVSGLQSSAFYNKVGTLDPSYQPYKQRFDPIFGALGYKERYGQKENRTILNFRVGKFFMDKKFNAFVWANDILTDPFIESVNQLKTAYPRQIGRMFGLGLTYNLQ